MGSPILQVFPWPTSRSIDQGLAALPKGRPVGQRGNLAYESEQMHGSNVGKLYDIRCHSYWLTTGCAVVAVVVVFSTVTLECCVPSEVGFL